MEVYGFAFTPPLLTLSGLAWSAVTQPRTLVTSPAARLCTCPPQLPTHLHLHHCVPLRPRPVAKARLSEPA